MEEDGAMMVRDENDLRTARDAFLAARAMLGGGKSELTVSSVDIADLQASADYDGSIITAHIVGNGDASNHDAFHRFMVELHDDALRLHVESVTIDMRDLFFMSSSCLKAFVTWLGKIEELESPYRVRLVGSVHRHWQARSLPALQAFSIDIVTLEIS